MSLTLPHLLNLTFRSLLSNPLRSTLTTLGVFMGVAAVNATLQVGSISRELIAQRLAERQAPQVTVFPQWIPGPGNAIQLKMQDLTFLQSRLSGVQSISGVEWLRPRSVTYLNREIYPSLNVVTQSYLNTVGQTMVAGRFFTVGDFANFRPVVVVDEVAATQLFRTGNGIGERIYIDRQPYGVVGILPSTPDEDDDDPERGRILIPLAFHSALTGQQDIGSIRLRPYRLDDLNAIGEEAEQLLTRRFPGQRFYVWNNVEDILEQRSLLQLAARGLAVVGAISLVVGGIGIANIMIASVTERTSEIGLRRAIGATQRDIMLQFVLEAVLLSLVGGMTAIALVHSLTGAVAKGFELPYRFNSQTALVSLASALAVGVGASLPPALRASRIDPVRALRSD